MLQSLEQFKTDLRQGLKVHLAMNKVTEHTPYALKKIWDRQYRKRVRWHKMGYRDLRISSYEFMQKKKTMLHRFMDLVYESQQQRKAA